MNNNFKEKLQNRFENYLKESKKQRKKKALYQQKIDEELRKENTNLDNRGKARKILKFFLIIVLYNIFRMLLRYKSSTTIILYSDFVFSLIIVVLYAIYIINYKKYGKKKVVNKK